MSESKLDLLQGTLDLMVLQTLASMGELHGYGIAEHSRRQPGTISQNGRRARGGDPAVAGKEEAQAGSTRGSRKCR